MNRTESSARHPAARIAIQACLLALGGASLACGSGRTGSLAPLDHEAQIDDPTAHALDAENPSALAAHDYLQVPGFPVEWTDDYRQILYLEEYSPTDRRVRLVTKELDDGEWHETTDELTAAFFIDCVATRFADELFVGGKTARGWGVIERWERLVPDGTPSTSLRLPGPNPDPIGSPTQPAFFQRDFVGGSSIPLPTRGNARGYRRTEIALGDDVPVPDVMNVDPEGRFLLYVDEASTLQQVDLLADPPTVTELYTVGELSPLANACYFAIYQHATYGRFWIVRTSACGGSDDAILFDHDNDGVFDEFSIDTSLAINLSAYVDSNLATAYP